MTGGLSDHTSQQSLRSQTPSRIGCLLGRRVVWGRGQARGTVGRRRPSTEAPFCEAAVSCWIFWGAKPLLLPLWSLLGVSAAASCNGARLLLLRQALCSLPDSRGRRPISPCRISRVSYPRHWKAAPLLAACAVSFQRASSCPTRGPLLSGSLLCLCRDASPTSQPN